mgnify:CR=1 FL=1
MLVIASLKALQMKFLNLKSKKAKSKVAKKLTEKAKNIKEKVKKILAELEKKFGEPKCALDFKTPFELLVAVILSAQCTDKRVNIVTEEMFKHVNTPEQFANMKLEEIDNQPYMIGSFNKEELDYMVHYLIGLGDNVKIEYPELVNYSHL